MGLFIGSVAILIFVLVGVRGGLLKKLVGEERSAGKVTIRNDGAAVTVGRDGVVEFNRSGEISYEQWSTGKVSAFFDYYKSKYAGANETDLVAGGIITFYWDDGSESTYVIGDDDELSDIISEDEGGGEDGGGGEPISDYFDDGDDDGDDGDGSDDGDEGSWPWSTATPRPTVTPASGGDETLSECLYWRLTYCVRYRTPSPQPTATPPGDVSLPPTCSELENKTTGRTVISNELCIDETTQVYGED